DGSVVALEARLEKRQAALADTLAAAECDRRSIEEYAALVKAEEDARRKLSPSRADIAAAVAPLKPGDVIDVGGSAGRAAVVSVANRKGGGPGAVRVRAVSTRRKLLTLGADDFDEPPEVLATIELPVPYTPHQTKFQHAVAARV